MKFIYTGNSKSSGIYKIFNAHTNRTYVGQAKSFQQRWYDHRRSLLAGKHQNKFLQKDFNKCQELFGHDNFLEFHVVEVMEGSTKEERNRQEEFHIQLIWDSKLPDNTRACYNFKEKTEAKDRSCHSSTPGETRAKKSLKSKEMWASPGFKEANTEAIRAGTMKPESRKLRSEAMKEVWRNPEHREKVVAHRQRPELKEAFKVNCPSKMAVAKSIEVRKKLYGKVRSPTGEIYEVWSLSGFCREHGLGAHSHGNLGRLLTGKYAQLRGWTRVLDG